MPEKKKREQSKGLKDYYAKIKAENEIFELKKELKAKIKELDEISKQVESKRIRTQEELEGEITDILFNEISIGKKTIHIRTSTLLSLLKYKQREKEIGLKYTGAETDSEQDDFDMDALEEYAKKTDKSEESE